MADDADKKDETSEEVEAEAKTDAPEGDAAADVVDFDESDGDTPDDEEEDDDGDDSEVLDAEVAAAEAAAAAAAAKAAAAKAKAKAKAKGKSKSKKSKKSAEAKAEADGDAPAKPEKSAKAVKAKSGAKASFVPLAEVEPHADGLFKIANAKSAEDYVPPSPMQKRSMIAFTVFGLAVASLVIGGAVIYSDDDTRHDMQCFFEGGDALKACKLHEVRLKEKKWKEEDQAAQNRYGNVTINYFPGDAVLKVTEYEFGQAGMEGEAVEKGSRDIPNKSQQLKEGQTIERIPLTNLRVFEAVKYAKGHAQEGSVDKAFKYEYKLEFSKPGYHSATVWLRDKSSGLPPRKDGKSYYWERKGPGNLLIPWQGLDLEPKLETIKANFVAFKAEAYCYLQKNEKIKEWKEVDETEREIIRLKHEFKDDAQLQAAEDGLTAGKYRDWWAAEWKKIQETKCGEEAK